MSSSLQGPSTCSDISPWGEFLEFVFPNKTLNGPILEVKTGGVEYLIESPFKLIGKGITSVNRADGTNVGSIDWRGSLDPHHRIITLHGRTTQGNKFLQNVSGGLLEETRMVWEDDSENEFYWANGCCHNARDEIIARHVHGKRHLVRGNEPAHLMVDINYLPWLDRILFTTIMIEHEVLEAAPLSGSWL
ncbi:hypothetical protein FRB96_002448 [Tulasnella sp. 330]|nr:hypothetical protein FRB96_002448 [Tulasnella sp. 330]KAG8885616.1 hypothetical protein FRB97_000524 [Tulasnella sp. 331]